MAKSKAIETPTTETKLIRTLWPRVGQLEHPQQRQNLSEPCGQEWDSWNTHNRDKTYQNTVAKSGEVGTPTTETERQNLSEPCGQEWGSRNTDNRETKLIRTL